MTDPVSASVLDLLKTGSPWALVVLLGAGLVGLFRQFVEVQNARIADQKESAGKLLGLAETLRDALSKYSQSHDAQERTLARLEEANEGTIREALRQKSNTNER